MRRSALILAFPVFALAAACGGSDSSGGTGPNTDPGTSAPPTVTNAVGVSDDEFSPPNIQVSPGTTVTWTWTQGASTHNVTFADGTVSGDKSAGATFQRTFNTAGKFTYVCTIHSGMQGSVLVQ
jgi:plastocyanin